jgi:hypothetical protein
MQVLDLPARAAPRPHDAPAGLSRSRFQLHYDAEWLAVLRSTQGFYPRHVSAQMPAPDRPVPFLPVRAPDTPAPAAAPRDDMAVARFDFRPTREEQAEVLRLLPDMAIPDNFSKVCDVETQPTRIHAHFLIFSYMPIPCSPTDGRFLLRRFLLSLRRRPRLRPQPSDRCALRRPGSRRAHLRRHAPLGRPLGPRDLCAEGEGRRRGGGRGEEGGEQE